VPTLRLLLAATAVCGWKVEQMDVKTAFLYGVVDEEIYMKQPEGYDDGSGRVCRLNKAIYGLKQAPRCWYARLVEALEALGFKVSGCDDSLFMTEGEEEKVFLLVYVDDILLFSPSLERIKEVQGKLKETFQCKALGPVGYYLGLHVERDEVKGWLRLHQQKYLAAMGEKYGLEEGRSVKTPLPSGFQLHLNEEEVEVLEYDLKRRFQSIVGSLLYASVNTRPDIAFSVSQLARVVSRPLQEHLDAAERLVRYCMATSRVGLQYSVHGQLKQKGVEEVSTKTGAPARRGHLYLSCFTDATWASDISDATSHGGYICCVGGSPVSWKSKKQGEIAHSSTDSEYMALFHGVKEVVWMRRLLEELGQEQEGTTSLPSTPPPSLLTSSTAGGAGAGVAEVGGPSAGGAGAVGAGAVDPGAGGAGGTVWPRPYFVPLLQQSGGLPERREPASCPVSPVRTAGRAPHLRPPPVLGTHTMALRPQSDRARAASPTVARLLVTAVTDPSFESAAASALVVELLDFAAACRLDYASALVTESVPAGPPSIRGECALSTDVLEDRQEDFECPAAAVPHFASLLLASTRHTQDYTCGSWFCSFYSRPVLVYADDLVFATADTEALTLVAAQELRWLTYLLTDLGEAPRSPPVLYQRGQLHLAYVASQANTADVFTKALPPCDHQPCFTFLTGLVTPCSPPLCLWGTSGMGLVLGGRGPVVLTGHADASWVHDSATQRSSQGYTFSLGSSSVSWRSTRSSSVLSSSCEAEIYAGAIAAQELRWLTYLLTDLEEQPRSPPVLYADNKAMIALCQEHRLEHRTKHIALRYFLARELLQRGELRLAYVATRANTADVFTKALPPGDHQRFVTVLGLVPTLPHLLTA
ncbi:unnamed protein product, partial [Closterium sp. NIES-53]